MAMVLLLFKFLLFMWTMNFAIACTSLSHGAPVAVGRSALKSCNSDENCAVNTFCYLKTKTCTDCVDCSKYQRFDHEGALCARSQSECGDCRSGFKDYNGHCLDNNENAHNRSEAFFPRSDPNFNWIIPVVVVVLVIPCVLCLVHMARRRGWKKMFISGSSPTAEECVPLRDLKDNVDGSVPPSAPNCEDPPEEEYRPPPSYNEAASTSRAHRTSELTVHDERRQRALPFRRGNGSGQWVQDNGQVVPQGDDESNAYSYVSDGDGSDADVDQGFESTGIPSPQSIASNPTSPSAVGLDEDSMDVDGEIPPPAAASSPVAQQQYVTGHLLSVEFAMSLRVQPRQDQRLLASPPPDCSNPGNSISLSSSGWHERSCVDLTNINFDDDDNDDSGAATGEDENNASLRIVPNTVARFGVAEQLADVDDEELAELEARPVAQAQQNEAPLVMEAEEYRDNID